MANENPPLINLPEESGEYKIIQFDSDSQPYLRFGRELRRYGDFHEHILKRFSREIRVECITIIGPDGLVAALPDNISYRMCGAGMCQVNLEDRTAIFSGGSYDYKTRINKEHLQRLMVKLPEWQIK